MKCPCCKGTGHLPEPRSSERDKSAERARMAQVLRDAGYSIRQIGAYLEYKSPRSVVPALERKFND